MAKFEYTFIDFDKSRAYVIKSVAIDNEDAGYITDIFNRMSPEMREYSVKLARMIVENVKEAE